ncbi:MAG: hypothetical protein A2Z47_11860 [Thermodesulfovibrio sp. RBG_19FT_COMBO_42_12]|nr:MAG: hypothetical protein A2Z47_11860 [Thermodesulfovibrio sp. RBG_19FT_COMBO_42_12]
MNILKVYVYEYFRAYQYGTCGSLIFLSFPLVGNPSYRELFKKGIQKDSGQAGITYWRLHEG